MVVTTIDPDPQLNETGVRSDHPALVAAVMATAIVVTGPSSSADPWPRHTIDQTSRGADGVRLADANGDGRLDITTGWEEGGVVRVYLRPAADLVRDPWPMIEVGHVVGSEDAVFADVDGDGHVDVVSCCEGKTRSVYVHWNPGSDASDQQPWPTDAFPQLQGQYPWMYCLPVADEQQRAAELFVGSKGGTGVVGRLLPPPQGDLRNLSAWTWQPLHSAGWLMSLRSEDVDGDGLSDLVYTDRRTKTRGVHWLKRPADERAVWQRFTAGGQDREVMFLDIGDLNNDGRRDIVCAAKDPQLLVLLRGDRPDAWEPINVSYPSGVGTGKGVAIGDINGDQQPDLVCTCENAKGTVGVYWLSAAEDLRDPWTFHDVSGQVEGIKFDRVELLDLDDDGDLDILTCEERDNLGVVWYENPSDGQEPRR